MTDNWLEKAIAEAQARGDFDGLAGSGKPIEGIGGTYDPAWWAKGFVGRERAREAGIELMAEIDASLPKLLAGNELDVVLSRVDEWNRAIGAVNEALDARDRLARLDVEDVARRWSALRA